MTMKDMLDTIRTFAYSQGFYGRLYNDIMDLYRYDPMLYDELVEEWESYNFETELDFILFLEGA